MYDEKAIGSMKLMIGVAGGMELKSRPSRTSPTNRTRQSRGPEFVSHAVSPGASCKLRLLQARGTRRALRDMPGCFLVRTHDPADLARGLEAAIAELASDQGREVRRHLVQERYSVDAMVDAYERLYLRQAS